MKLPIYDIIIDSDTDELNMSCISLVTDPAVEKDFECFSKNNKPMKFSVTDQEKHCITGVAIRADVPIYRYSPDKGEYYVRFSKETIEQIVYKYSKQNLWNSVSLEHSGQNIDSAVMVEFYLKSENKCPKGFEEIENGSLMVTYKITDENLWDTVKNSDEINGFSIEIMADLQPTNEFVESDLQPLNEFVKNEEEDFFENLMNWLSEEKKNYSIDRGSIRKAIEDEKVVMIDEGGEKAVEYYPHSLGKKSGNDIVVLFNPSTKKWKTEYLKDVDCVVGKDSIGEFIYTDPTYEKIMDDEDIVITRTKGSTSYSDLIHNRVMTMIAYNDEKDKPALGFRQCAIIAHGYTKAGNECLRIMEVFGDSRSARDGEGIIPDYRLLLTKRIKSLKILTGTAPWSKDILDSRVNLTGDKSMSPCITHITKEDLEK